MGNLLIAGSSVIHHIARAPVYRDHIRAGRLAHTGKLRREHIVLMDSRPTLYRHGLSAFFAAADDCRSPFLVQHQRAAFSAFKHIGNRAPHIDINYIKASQQFAASHLLHHRRYAAQQLDGFDGFLRRGKEQTPGGLVLILQRIGAGHFRKAKPCPHLIGQHPERVAGVSGQRRHQDIGGQKKGSDAQFFDHGVSSKRWVFIYFTCFSRVWQAEISSGQWSNSLKIQSIAREKTWIIWWNAQEKKRLLCAFPK